MSINDRAFQDTLFQRVDETTEGMLKALSDFAEARGLVVYASWAVRAGETRRAQGLAVHRTYASERHARQALARVLAEASAPGASDYIAERADAALYIHVEIAFPVTR